MIPRVNGNDSFYLDPISLYDFESNRSRKYGSLPRQKSGFQIYSNPNEKNIRFPFRESVFLWKDVSAKYNMATI